MTAKEYLSQIRAINIRLACMARQKQSLEDALINISPSYSDMPHSATRNVHRLEELIAAKIDIDNELAEYAWKMTEIMRTISDVPDPITSRILTARYVNDLSWHDVASELNLSESHLYRLHRTALTEIEKLIGNDS